MQALSPMPELLSYWIDAPSALELSRHVNGVIAADDRRRADAVRGPGHGPAAGRGPRGGRAGPDRGRRPARGGDRQQHPGPLARRFRPSIRSTQSLSGLTSACSSTRCIRWRRSGWSAPSALAAFIGFPVPTPGLAAASFITGRTLEKFPKLRDRPSVTPAGTLAAILPRLQNGWSHRAGPGQAPSPRPRRDGAADVLRQHRLVDAGVAAPPDRGVRRHPAFRRLRLSLRRRAGLSRVAPSRRWASAQDAMATGWSPAMRAPSSSWASGLNACALRTEACAR